jgi:prevent-host-death family protein
MSSFRPSTDVRPVTEFRANTSAVIEQMHSSKRPVILTQHGRSTAVLLDVDVYEGMVDELEFMRDLHIAEARNRPATAARWLEHLLESAGSLAEFPDKAPLADEAKRDDIRELTVSPYRIIYRRDPGAVYITMVLHERQHFDVDDVQ